MLVYIMHESVSLKELVHLFNKHQYIHFISNKTNILSKVEMHLERIRNFEDFSKITARFTLVSKPPSNHNHFHGW